MQRAGTPYNRFLTFLPYLLFFLVTSIFFFWFAAYIFFYQEKLSLFLVSSEFLREHLPQPGGFLHYLATFLTAFYRFKLVGAVLLLTIILLVVRISALIGKEIAGKPVYFLPFLVGAGLVFLNNIALAETGQLTERMFEFPQSPEGETLFLKWETIGEVLRRGGHFYYTLGLINEAQRWAYEYMVMRGHTPEGLKMLIKTELISGNYKVAAKYIEILHYSLFYRDEAREFKKLLNNDEAVDNHPELGQKKQLKPKTDFFVLSNVPAANLEPLLEMDSTNFFAMEYQFAWLLLQKDVQAVTAHLPLLEKVGYNHIPRHVDEAATGFKLLNMGEFPQLKYLRPKAETEQQFRQYYQTFQQNSNSREQAQRALYPQFSDTFWYYLFFD